MISSRPHLNLDVAEKAQLALYEFFQFVDAASKKCGKGGLQRLDIQVVDGAFAINWAHGQRHQKTSERGQKIEHWADLRFIPKD